MTLTLDVPNAAASEARAFLAALAPVAPDARTQTPQDDTKRDPATALALATLVLTLPGAVLATLEIKDRLDRREIQRTLTALKDRLAAEDGSARLTLPSGTSLDLARTSTDAAIDLVIKDLGGRR